MCGLVLISKLFSRQFHSIPGYDDQNAADPVYEDTVLDDGAEVNSEDQV